MGPKGFAPQTGCYSWATSGPGFLGLRTQQAAQEAWAISSLSSSPSRREMNTPGDSTPAPANAGGGGGGAV